MSVILDTHVFYWWIIGSDRLPQHHRSLVTVRGETVYVSAVTGWEIALQVKLGKWPDAEPILPGLEQAVVAEGFTPLAITLRHAKLAGSLDLIHKDPFDRMLAAQAIDIDVPIATVDVAIGRLGCRTV